MQQTFQSFIVHSCHISLFLYQLKCQIRIIELSLSCKSLNYCLHLCGVRESKRMLLQCSFGFVSKLRLPVYDNFRLQCMMTIISQNLVEELIRYATARVLMYSLKCYYSMCDSFCQIHNIIPCAIAFVRFTVIPRAIAFVKFTMRSPLF